MADPLSFFLGGRDLEMATIHELLLASGIAPEDLHDGQLPWGAKVSAYREQIERALAAGRTPVLVELEDDLGLGDGAIHIDHHGPRGGGSAPTSLHQIFALLQLPADRWTAWFERVAANDRGWIPELRALGLTDQEIASIRAADRKAQGITADDETGAEQAIASAETIWDGKLTIVRLPHNRISPVTDRLAVANGPEQNILVISQAPTEPRPAEINFSGEGWIVAMLDGCFPGGWTGGALPERGFWGHGDPVPDVRKFLLLFVVAGDPETKEGGATFSRFVLPFKYRLKRVEKPAGGQWFEKDVSLDEKTGRVYERLHYLTLETAGVLFRRASWFKFTGPSESFWIPSCGDPTRKVKVTRADLRIVLFEYSAPETPGEIDADLLRTGFLLFDLHFTDPASIEENGHFAAPRFDDLLRLNELFRYWRRPYYEHQLAPALGNLAACLSGNSAYHERWAAMLDLPIVDGDRAFELFPRKWGKEASQDAAHPARMFKEALGDTGPRNSWVTYADNRTYVWTCAILDKGLNTLRLAFDAKAAPAEALGHWVKLLNVDMPGPTPEASNSTREFETEWARERSQKRWEESGTVYGFTTHSGAMLAAPSVNPPLVRHFADMYFDQTLLLLYVRVTTFRFSEALSAISAKARDGGAGNRKADNVWRSEFDRLRRDFALFTNLYQFPLVSNQQQGIELYSCARTGLDIDDLFKEVQQEINSTHDYFELLDTRQQMQTTTVMSLAGGFGLAVALAMTFLSMNMLKFTAVEWPLGRGTIGTAGEWLLLILTVAVSALLLFGLARVIRWTFFRTRHQGRPKRK